MPRLIVDASVALKWFLKHRSNEAFVSEALELGERLGTNQYKLLVPPHFEIEVASVLARSEPALVNFAIGHIQQLVPTVVNTRSSLQLGASISSSLPAWFRDADARPCRP